MEELGTMSVASLKQQLADLGLPSDDCIEKAELVGLLQAERGLSKERPPHARVEGLMHAACSAGEAAALFPASHTAAQLAHAC